MELSYITSEAKILTKLCDIMSLYLSRVSPLSRRALLILSKVNYLYSLLIYSVVSFGLLLVILHSPCLKAYLELALLSVKLRT